MIKEIMDLLESIPNVVWSGVIASTLTLGGVLIANRSNTSRLRIQLNHDASEKAKERIFTLRREIYLATTESLSRANSNLSSLPQRVPEHGNPADIFKDFFASAAQLQLVAETKTALLVNELVASYGSMVLRLIEQAGPLQLLRSQIAQQDNLYNMAQAEVNRVLSEMARFTEQAKTDRVTFEALHRSFEGFQKRANDHAEKRGKLWDEFNELNAEFAKVILVEMREIGSSQIPVLVEIRRELELNTDLESYKTQLETQWQKINTQITEMIDRIQKG